MLASEARLPASRSLASNSTLKCLLEERHELQRRQRIEDAAFLELGIVGEVRRILAWQEIVENEADARSRVMSCIEFSVAIRGLAARRAFERGHEVAIQAIGDQAMSGCIGVIVPRRDAQCGRVLLGKDIEEIRGRACRPARTRLRSELRPARRR